MATPQSSIVSPARSAVGGDEVEPVDPLTPIARRDEPHRVVQTELGPSPPHRGRVGGADRDAGDRADDPVAVVGAPGRAAPRPLAAPGGLVDRHQRTADVAWVQVPGPDRREIDGPDDAYAGGLHVLDAGVEIVDLVDRHVPAVAVPVVAGAPFEQAAGRRALAGR